MISERWTPVHIEYRKTTPWMVRAWVYQIMVSLPALGVTALALWMLFYYQHSPVMMAFCLPAAILALINLWRVINIGLNRDEPTPYE